MGWKSWTRLSEHGHPSVWPLEGAAVEASYALGVCLGDPGHIQIPSWTPLWGSLVPKCSQWLLFQERECIWPQVFQKGLTEDLVPGLSRILTVKQPLTVMHIKLLLLFVILCPVSVANCRSWIWWVFLATGFLFNCHLAIPVLLPGRSHGWRSRVGCSPWGR